MKTLLIPFSLVLAIFLFSVHAFTQTAGFNEIFDSQGQVRRHYQEVYSLWNQRHAQNPAAFLEYSRQKFSGDNALDPMPRLIEDVEYDELKRGVDQRARAIRAFLADHYSGNKKYAAAGVIPETVVNRIIARSGEAGYEGLLAPNSLSFFYGPDIIKDPQGQWRVIEDNLGFIGGVGDLKLAQDLTLSSYPELGQYAPRKAIDFYAQLAASYKQRAEKFGGKAILYTIPAYASDREDRRISDLFAKQGIQTITPNTAKKLKIKKDGVYLESKNASGRKIYEKVGFIFMNGEHAWMDPTHPAAVQKTIIEDASDLLKDPETDPETKKELSKILNNLDPATHLPNLKKLSRLLWYEGYEVDKRIAKKNRGMLNAILQGKVGSNYSPGVDFVGDKEFYVYMEELVKFYLREEPIIKNIETKKFNLANSHQTNEDLMKSVFENLKEYVIKKVDGRGGDSVWVGPKIPASETTSLMQAIRANPDLYIVQRFTALSTLNENIVDLRVITDVSPTKILVTDTPWGRGLPKDGNGKVNLSDQGREVTVLVVNPRAHPRSCTKIFLN